MRISDWSSDVCSSDLHRSRALASFRFTLPWARKPGIAPISVSRVFWSAADSGYLYAKRCVSGSATGASREGTSVRCGQRSEEHTSELQSLMRISYAVFCLKKKKIKSETSHINTIRTSHNLQLLIREQHRNHNSPYKTNTEMHIY